MCTQSTTVATKNTNTFASSACKRSQHVHSGATVILDTLSVRGNRNDNSQMLDLAEEYSIREHKTPTKTDTLCH